MSFKYVPFTKKQLQLLTWWSEKSPYKNMSGIIADGAIRSGKTIIMGLSFIFWSMQNYENTKFAICGKTVGSARRNIIEPLTELLKKRGYRVVFHMTEGKIVIGRKGVTNTYYIFGGRDERSASLIQGITLAGVLLDEAALMPRSFVEQAIARCSVKGAKLWFNCNPEGPRHWLKKEWIDKAKEKKILRIQFMLEDNPSLDEETLEKYHSMYQGIFYKRFILGEWAFADGIVYPNIPEESYYTNAMRDNVLPIKIREGDIKPMYAADAGTINPQIYLEVYKIKKPDSSIPYFYVENEYCWNSREKLRQKTNEEYVQDFKRFTGGKKYIRLIIDPSAGSLKVAHQRAGDLVTNAKNDISKGIAMVGTLFGIGHIYINRDNCPNLVEELGLYKWDEKKSENGKEEVVKTNDHSCDALRYAIYTTTSEFEVYGFGGKQNGKVS